MIAKKDLWRYSLLALPLAFAGLPIYLLAPDFYATSYGIPLTYLGLSLLILRFSDAILDPFLGWFIDRYQQYFRTIMSAGTALMALGLIMLFWVPELPQNATLAWFSVAVFLTTFAYSILAIGYGTQGAAWSDNHKEQVRITSSRETLTLVGLIFAIGLPFALLALFDSAISAYRLLAIVLTATLIISFIIYQAAKTPGFDSTKSPHKDELQNKEELESRKLPGLYAVYGLSALASAIPAVLVIFFVRDYLGRMEMTALYLFLYFFAAICSMGLWRSLAGRWGKLEAWRASMFLAVAGFCLVLTVQPGELYLYALVCLITGVALGAELCLPPALLSEIVKGNSQGLGLKYAGLTSLNKLCLAFAAGLSLPVLGMLEFVPAANNSAQALSALLWLYGGIPCVLKILAAIFSFFIQTNPGQQHAKTEPLGFSQSSATAKPSDLSG